MDREYTKYSDLRKAIKGRIDIEYYIDVRDTFDTLRPTHFPNFTNPSQTELTEWQCYNLIEYMFSILIGELLDSGPEHLGNYGIIIDPKEKLYVEVDSIQLDTDNNTWSISTQGPIKITIYCNRAVPFNITVNNGKRSVGITERGPVRISNAMYCVLKDMHNDLDVLVSSLIVKYKDKFVKPVDKSIYPDESETKMNEAIELLQQAALLNDTNKLINNAIKLLKK